MCEGAIHTFLTHAENYRFKLNHEHIRLWFHKVVALCALTEQSLSLLDKRPQTWVILVNQLTNEVN